MEVRLGRPDDEDAVVALTKRDVAETLPHLDCDEAMVRETYRRYLKTAVPTVFVADDNGVVIGFLLAYIHGYAFTRGIFTVQEVLYVDPTSRGTRAAAHLMAEFVRWSDMLGARENIGGNSNEFHSERTARFLEHFGFKKVGYSMKRVPGR